MAFLPTPFENIILPCCSAWFLPSPSSIICLAMLPSHHTALSSILL
uniref:Uncharacterized protein n=1 Tax=Moniliophthora roreri TaxID=221103 RepID=A0A0W0FID9_MONRR